MKNPSFRFTLGKPAEGAAGRWIEGQLKGDAAGYLLQADLHVVENPSLRHLNWIEVRIDRDFDAAEFAALLRPLFSGRFATSNYTFILEDMEPADSDPTEQIAGELGVWRDERQWLGMPVEADLARLNGQLREVYKREMLGNLFACGPTPVGTVRIMTGDACDGRSLRGARPQGR